MKVFQPVFKHPDELDGQRGSFADWYIIAESPEEALQKAKEYLGKMSQYAMENYFLPIVKERTVLCEMRDVHLNGADMFGPNLGR